MKPFGFRILVKVEENIANILADKILTGTIVEMPQFSDIAITNICQKPYQDSSIILYCHAMNVLKIGTKIEFNNEEKLINVKDGIYNVPVELIRGYY